MLKTLSPRRIWAIFLTKRLLISIITLMPERKNFSVIPGGEWGSAFGGFVVAPRNHKVLLYLPDPEEVRSFRRTGRVERLPDSIMPYNVRATADLEEAVMGADVLVMASRAQSLRTRYRQTVPYIQSRRIQPIRMILSKGIEQGTHLLMSDVILQEDPGCNDLIVCLSGPTLAKEIAKGAVAGAAVGADNPRIEDQIQSWLNSSRFKIYTARDLKGVQLGGALKNIYALGAGMFYVLDPSRSTRALYFTRSLEEAVGVGVALGAHESTIRSLSNQGDFSLAFDDFNGGATRNFRAGVRLAQGQLKAEVIAAEKTVEGLYTIESARALAEYKGVPIPMMLAIKGVIDGGLVHDGVNQLLGQQPTREQNGNKGWRFKLGVLWRRIKHNLAGILHQHSLY